MMGVFEEQNASLITTVGDRREMQSLPEQVTDSTSWEAGLLHLKNENPKP